METQEKIKQINTLSESIDELKSFLSLLEKSNIMSEYSDKNHKKMNEFSYLYISSHIYTGSDNPEYKRKIGDKYTINILSEVIKPVLTLRISDLECKLSNLLK